MNMRRILINWKFSESIYSVQYWFFSILGMSCFFFIFTVDNFFFLTWKFWIYQYTLPYTNPKLFPTLFFTGLMTEKSCDIIVMAATNRPQDIDHAILRRLPCRFHIGLPVSNTAEVFWITWWVILCWIFKRIETSLAPMLKKCKFIDCDSPTSVELHFIISIYHLSNFKLSALLYIKLIL